MHRPVSVIFYSLKPPATGVDPKNRFFLRNFIIELISFDTTGVQKHQIKVI